jgi:hypothetical protein
MDNLYSLLETNESILNHKLKTLDEKIINKNFLTNFQRYSLYTDEVDKKLNTYKNKININDR